MLQFTEAVIALTLLVVAAMFFRLARLFLSPRLPVKPEDAADTLPAPRQRLKTPKQRHPALRRQRQQNRGG